MAPFRNFLARKSAAPNGAENSVDDEKTRTSSETRSSPLSIRKSHENGNNEFKLSVVSDNGVYLPPSPPERGSFWSTKSSNHHRDLVDDNEPFSISRESFDSYRRSFDISARSPVSYTDTMPSRTSLDSRYSRMTSSPATRGKSFEKGCPESTEEESFEEVGLNDDLKPKKKGIFSRFGDFSSSNEAQPNSSRPTSSHLGFHIPGRRRGQSGGASELSSVEPQPAAAETESS